MTSEPQDPSLDSPPLDGRSRAGGRPRRRPRRAQGQRDAARQSERRTGQRRQGRHHADSHRPRFTPEQVELRRASVPELAYPELPVSAVRDEIAALIRDHQVVVVAGETGSGKTTQLPKICLELGRGATGMIGHTQPRRIAARTVAERIAEEIGTDVGDLVGWTVRFTDRVGDRTLLKVMTDGILLAEIQRDRMLSRYDTLIIDEAHERSLNIDFILGYLKTLLPKRPDLKVVITSATIDVERFSQHFDGAPVIEVSGRTYPVEVRYRPVVDPDDPDSDPDRDQVQAICDAVVELQAEGDGDVLVFLSGEREIRDTADALNAMSLRTEILPLYARLSAADQHRVFQSHPGRRVVLATNVAETSLTVPGIRYVVDPGTARISRYSRRLKVQRLPIEKVSQASANQRAGRCGRVADGICIRLYSQEDFESRPAFTEPEILRTNLAAVILQMTAIGLGDIAAFPFVEPPDRRAIRDGVQLLHELGAIASDAVDPRRRLTPIGRQLAKLPLDPRLARMLVEADKEGCLREVLVVAAALSIQDPRERPPDAQQQADAHHARFADPTSDFLSWLNLWRYLREQQNALSSNQFRRLCRSEHLHYLRVREWQDVRGQLQQGVKAVGLALSGSVDEIDAAGRSDHLHRALLSGLLSHVGLREGETRDYLGARGAKFAIWPGSALAKKPPTWVMAAELVETSRLWGRTVGRIEPEWAEALAPHLVKRTYSEPRWSARRGSVVADERVTLYGVPLVAGRTVGYGRIDPALSRELFIRHALVEGDWHTRHRFFHANRELLEDVEELEQRTRRRGLVVDDETLVAFYDARVPADVVSGRHFDAWWKKARRDDPELLTFTPDLVVTDEGQRVSEEDYPTSWPLPGDETLAVTYQFEPGTAADGVTVHVPLALLPGLRPEPFGWQIPGLRQELVTALIRSLPKAVRRSLIPAPDRAAQVLRWIEAEGITCDDGSLLDVLSKGLELQTGTRVSYDDWAPDAVPAHLRITFRVVDPTGRTLGEGKDLGVLQDRLRPRVQAALSRAADDLEVSGLTGWTIDELPLRRDVHQGSHTVEGFPALVDEGDSVAVRVLPSAVEAVAAQRAGLRRLLRLGLASPNAYVLGRLSNASKLALSRADFTTAAGLMEDCADAAVDVLVAELVDPVEVRGRDAYQRLRSQVRARLNESVLDVVRQVEKVLALSYEVRSRLTGTVSLPLLPSLTDLQHQLESLVHSGFVTQAGAARLPDLQRYLQAMLMRLDKLPDDVGRDRGLQAQVAMATAEYETALADVRPGRRPSPELLEVRWMIEELRVSLFAQTLRTAYPVSVKRIHRAIVAAT